MTRSPGRRPIHFMGASRRHEVAAEVPAADAGEPAPIAVSTPAPRTDTTIPPLSGSWEAFADRFLLAPGGADATAIDPLVGVELGGVRLERLIGSGGMGRVYEGTQQRPSRPVAVKLMRPGLVAPSLLRRFEFEAEVLARLRHPGIATMHAAGTHRLGDRELPYFIMELIPGASTITRHASARRLDTRRRLELFRDACDAVAHGHRIGVIHRDLKPGNILVDDEGRVKVIDFGVACTTGVDVALATQERDVGRFVGTLQYMSPEQFAADPAALDVRSDVYALGVVLYELLAGRPPHDLRSTPFLQALTIVREAAPPPLPPATRGAGGELDAIVQTCLEKDRERRYGSAGELAADIGRFLAGESIVARPPGLVGSLVKLARRHSAATVALAGMLAALMSAVVGISVFAIRAERARKEAERERTRVVAERERADVETAVARRRLYVANLYRIADLAQAGSFGAGRALLEETATLLAPGMPRPNRFATARRPLELRILAAELDHAIAVADTGCALRSLAVSPDGRLVAAGGDDGRVRLWTMDDILRTGGGTAPRILAGHGAAVWSLVFSPDGTRLAAAGRDRVAHVWDLDDAAATVPAVTCTGHSSELDMVRFSPDGRLVATCSWDGTARLWDAATGVERSVFRAGKGRMSHVAFSPDGARLAVGSNDGVARIHDVATGAELARMEGHEGLLYGLAWSPDGALLATASLDHTARLWDAATGSARHVLEGHSGWVRSVAFSPDGTILATASEDGTSRTWDVATGGLRTTTTHDSAVSGLSFSRDGTRLLARTANLAASVWSPTATTPHALRGHAEPIFGLTFTPDGTLVASASADGSVRFWDATRPGRLPSLDGPPARRPVVAFGPGGTLLASTGDDGSIRLWDMATGRERTLLRGAPGRPVRPAFTGDGTRLLLAADGPEPRTELWDVDTGARVASLAVGHAGIAVAPDGTRLLTRLPPTHEAGALDDRGLSRAALWEARGGEPIAVLDGHSQFLSSAAFSADGRRVATASYDGTVRLWDATSGEAITSLVGHDAWVMAVAFTPDGRLVVTSSKDGTARTWDATTGAPRHVLRATSPASGDLPGGILLQALAPDGTRLALVDVDRVTTIWDVTSGSRLTTCASHAHQIVALEFSRDGTRLATGSTDGTARLWDPETGEELATLRHDGPIASMAFSPDGSCLATAVRGDGTVRLWGPSNAEWAAARREAPAPSNR